MAAKQSDRRMCEAQRWRRRRRRRSERHSVDRAAPVEKDPFAAGSQDPPQVARWIPCRCARRGAPASFVAALDAAQGHVWQREPIEDDPVEPRYGTQLRWVQRGGRLLGLSPEVTSRTAERIGEQLGLMGLNHRRCRTRFAQARGLRERGGVILQVLACIECDQALCSRMLAAGFLAGLWGAPRIWVLELRRSVSPLSRVARALRNSP